MAYTRMVKATTISVRINWAIAQFFRERFSGELLTAQTIRQMKPTMGIAEYRPPMLNDKEISS